MTDKARKAIVLLSGGLDSTTCLAIALSEGYECYGLSFAYGQRHDEELEAAARVARAYDLADHLTVDMASLGKIGGSSLTADIPVAHDRPMGQMEEGIPLTYVPARNTVFLSYALAWAEVLPATHIYIGVNALDYSGYPDCRPEYIEAFEKMARLATRLGAEGATIKIEAPLVTLTKAEIVARGVALGVDYGLTHSCYSPAAKGLACGRCDACRLRLRGFAAAGLTDPIDYQVRPDFPAE